MALFKVNKWPHHTVQTDVKCAKNSKLLMAVAPPKMEEGLFFYLSGFVAWDPTFTTEASFSLGSSVNMSFRPS